MARVGFIPKPSKTRFESGKSAAAQRKNAAEDMSPGTAASIAVQLLSAGDRDGVDRAIDIRTESAQSEFAVIARAQCFAHSGCS